MAKPRDLFVDHLYLKLNGSYILKDISLKVPAGSKVAIAGETGSGKSTLLKALAGLIDLDSGTILLDNEQVTGPAFNLVPGHPAVGFLNQSHDLPRALRVEQVLEYNRKIAENQAVRIFKVCRIHHLLARRTNELSGGERQRIALALLLLRSPEILLLDEPFSNLDLPHKRILHEVITHATTDLGVTTLMVSHEPDDILPWADSILLMKNGAVIQQGTPFEVYNQPESVYAAGLLGRYSVLEPEQAKVVASGESQRIFRPRQLRLVPVTNTSQCGIITNRFYFGSHFEYEVSFPDFSVLATSSRIYHGGEVVSVRFVPHD